MKCGEFTYNYIYDELGDITSLEVQIIMSGIPLRESWKNLEHIRRSWNTLNATTQYRHVFLLALLFIESSGSENTTTLDLS